MAAVIRVGDPWRTELVADGRSARWEFDGSVVTLALEAETSKINPRLASPSLLASLLVNLGLARRNRCVC